MDQDLKLAVLAHLHELSVAANRMLASIDAKVEGVTTETVEVNVMALHTLRIIIAGQDAVLRKMTEASANQDDKLEELLARLKK